MTDPPKGAAPRAAKPDPASPPPGPPPADPDLVLRAYRPGDENGLLAVLNAAFKGGWGDMARWQAKHGGRPGFDPRDIVVAEMGGRIVGCLHAVILPVHICEGLTLPLAMYCEAAVHPDARGRFVTEQLYAESQRSLHDRGIALRAGYTAQVTYRKVFGPRIGFVSDFDTSEAYRKVLDSSLVRDRLLALFDVPPGEPAPVEGPVLEVAITGIEPLQVRLGRRSVAVADRPVAKAALRVEADQRLFGLFAPGGEGLRGLPGLWLHGGIRVRRLATGGLRLAAWYLRHGRRLLKKGRAPR